MKVESFCRTFGIPPQNPTFMQNTIWTWMDGPRCIFSSFKGTNPFVMGWIVSLKKKKRYFGVLASKTSECKLIWTYVPYWGNQVKTEVIRVGPNPIWLMSLWKGEIWRQTDMHREEMMWRLRSWTPCEDGRLEWWTYEPRNTWGYQRRGECSRLALRVFKRNGTWCHPDLGLLTSRTVRL